MIAETTTVITDLPLIKIRTDGGTQSRAILDTAKVQEYEQIIKDDEGWPFPPLTVYHDGTEYWLADGFHRRAAAARNFLHHVPCEVRQGTRRDAVLFACGANATHGLPRNDADKRRAVETLLRDEEWSKWSDREIARRCAVSATFVGKLRAELQPTVHVDSRTYTRNGREQVMNTAEIGKPSPRQTAVSNEDLPASVWLLQSTMAGWFIPDWSIQDRLNFVNTALRGPGPARDDLMSRLVGLDYVHEDAITALENLREIYEGQLNAKRRKPETDYQKWLGNELEAIDEEVEEMLTEAPPPQTTAESNKRPTPPPGWQKWDGKTCPSGCVKNMTWQPAKYQEKTDGQYRTGACNECGCQLWADYGVPFAYYYNPMTARAKAADPRLEIISNIQKQIETLIVTGDSQKETELIGALAGVNVGLFKVTGILKRAK
jgi:hypothetical protein